jgi:hypothetical protein
MPKVMHVSFLWDDDTVNQRHSDYILSMGWVKSGWDVLYFDYRATAEEYGNDAMNESLISVVLQHQPDILWFTKSEGVSRRFGRRSVSCSIRPETIKRIKDLGFKGQIVHWFLDQRYDYFQSSLKIGRQCDWFFYVAGGERLVNYSKKMRTPASFILAPYEPSFLNPQPYEKRGIDLIWMGGAHKPKRNKFEDTRYRLLKQMIDTGQLSHYHGCFHHPRVYCPKYQQLLGSSKMGLSLYAFDRPMYFSNRLSHTIGSNTAVFSYDFKDRHRIFSDDEGIFFKDIFEFREKKNYYMENQDELEWIAGNGHKKAKQYFSSSRVIDEILHTLRNGESALPFGQTHNPRGVKFDVPESGKEYGDLYYMDRYGNFMSVDQYSSRYTVEEHQRRVVFERNKRRAESIKALHAQKSAPRLTKRANSRLVNRKPRIQ